MGTMLILLGAIISFIAGIWLLMQAFSQSIWWGLGSIFVPFVSLAFVFSHWQRTKRPFLISLGGIVLVIIGAVLGGGPAMPAPDNTPTP